MLVNSFVPHSEVSGHRKITIWPEWNEADLAMEKWDLAGGGGKGKDKTKGLHSTVVS